MRVAVVDIGTNSVKLSVADIEQDVTLVKELSRVTRLGKNVDSSGRLDPDAVNRTLEAIVTFVDEAKAIGAASIKTVGTSALRDASNGRDLIDAVKRDTGVDIEIITGEREASLAYKAVAGDPTIVQDNSSSLLVFDIGGGSTEMVWGHGGAMLEHVSLNIGAVRLTERHFRNDPPTDEEFAAAVSDAAATMRTFISGIGPAAVVCGVGGTAVTYAAMSLQTRDVQGKSISVIQLAERIKALRSVSLEQRRTVPYLDPQRADIIIAGGAILLSLLQGFGVLSYRPSVRGMRYGLLLEQKK